MAELTNLRYGEKEKERFFRRFQRGIDIFILSAER